MDKYGEMSAANAGAAYSFPPPGYPSPVMSTPSTYNSPITDYPSAVPYGFNQPPGPGGDADNFQLPPNVNVDHLPMADDNASSPTAPPLNTMDTIQGYGNVTFNNAPLAPPSYQDAVRDMAPQQRPEVRPIPVITEQAARDALLDYCSHHCCYGKGAAMNMTVANMASSSAFHYVLESFGEARSTAWSFAPYLGGPVDGPMNGPAPLPWDIMIYASQKFQNETKHIEVPHTSSVKQCHKCVGLGRLRCHHCMGRGRSHCTCHCGYTTIGTERRMCSFCHGSGYRVCMTCHGHGHVRCKVCNACGQLKWFILLSVVWVNHTDDFILERTALPNENIRSATGKTAFEEEQPWVFPVNHCPEPSVNQASAELVNKHRTQLNSERILMQRHRIRIVPVTEVSCLWKEKAFTFFVYGLENQVYTSKYPQDCCCGCSLL